MTRGERSRPGSANKRLRFVEYVPTYPGFSEGCPQPDRIQSVPSGSIPASHLR